MTGMHNGYVSPKLKTRFCSESRGQGLFAVEAVCAGELLVVWGGHILNESEMRRVSPSEHFQLVQVEEGLYLKTNGPREPSDCLNHSCDPNVGLRGQIALVAMRDIQPGEEICFDYAMTDSSPYDEFTCDCGAPNCRGSVTGNDWKNPALWERYAGYFSPYLQRRIDALKQQQP